ncbi:hypothetical protein B0J14DRAFT_491063 [Halenospora varia]|nr:hypothetical protein B0J14DRAFT_491063 [Halenospora varia]
MAAQQAICHVLLKESTNYLGEVWNLPKPTTPAEGSTVEGVDLIADGDSLITGITSTKISLEIRMKWVKTISDMFSRHPGLGDNSSIRDWDLRLGLDGSVGNVALNRTSEKAAEKQYPVRYRLPRIISDRLSTNGERVQRGELFALGSVLYYVLSGKELFHDEAEESIEDRIVKGEFPDELWTLSKSPRILGCWSPKFARELLASRGRGKSLISPPALSLLFLVGGVISTAALAAPAILGAIGFTAAGPAAGSIAAGWQAGIGVIEAGSLFAWCQSAAMGGAAVGGILFTGLSGAGLAVGAVVAGALDDMRAEDMPGMKEKFLAAWENERESTDVDLTEKLDLGEKF